MTAEGDTHELGIDGLGPGVRIGSGGSAAVYRARQEELDRDVAVKVLGGVIDDDARRRFDRERRLMGRLSEHEGMVTVHQTGFTARNEPFIVMPLLGRSLDDEMKVETMPWQRAVEIMSDVSRTVDFAHEQGIVHRDLKPGNIMLSTSGRPLVADFGIARIVDSKTNLEATMLTLTPAYSPPEALETTVADPSTDIYSLGATLFALISGHPPYCEPGRDRTLMNLMRSIVDEPAPDVGNKAPAEVQAIITRSMAKLPADRYASAADLADALEAVTTSPSLAAPSGAPRSMPPTPPPSAPTAEGNDSGSRTKLFVALAVVAALIVAGAGILIAQSGGGDDEVSAPEQTAAVDETDDVTEAVSGDPEAADEPVITVAAPAETDEPVDSVLVVEGGEVFLLPFEESGDGAFTDSVLINPTDELIEFVRVGGTATAVVLDPDDPESAPDEPQPTPGSTTAVTGRAGTETGVFAGTSGLAPCAPDELVAQLVPDAPETAVWAEIQQIEVDEIPEFVDGLTAAFLTADTRITDHEFIDGEAVPRQVVLQVGTGVLFDEFGALKVRCVSGSPLTTPEPVDGDIRYTGQKWDTFEPTDTVAVLAGPDPVEEFVLTDVEGGDDFVRPVGSSGATDRPLLPGEILATGGFTEFPEFDVSQLDTNDISLIFNPEGGDVTGDFGYSLTFKGLTIDVTGGNLSGTYDPVAGTLTATATATTNVSGSAGDTTVNVSGVVDPAAGTIVGEFVGDVEGRVPYELTFTPYDV